MDREDVERLVRVETGVSNLESAFATFKDETSTRLSGMDVKLTMLITSRASTLGVLGFLRATVPFVALAASLLALGLGAK